MKRVHCVGIGGIGISAIARVLLEQGIQITGSDLNLSPVALALIESGATVYPGHDASYVGDADAVLISSAVPEHNPEVVQARREGIPVFKRDAFLGQLMTDKIGIAIAGTHGKTTTTSMLTVILVEAGLDPTFIVGGIVQQLGTNAHAGKGAHFVIEADEYDRMFLGLKPAVAAVTHLEHDHPDCFPTFADMQDAFESFLDLVPADGLIVGCGDHPAVSALLQSYRTIAVQTCGLRDENDWHTARVKSNSLGGHNFEIVRRGQAWGSVRLQVPGVHNVQNALIAIAIADWLGIDQKTICQALAAFSGTQRRFEVRGEINGVVVVDDYGHHPTEINVTLGGAKIRYGNRPLWAVFQPHTFSRTKALWKAFLACFEQAEHVIVLDIYAAREKEACGISAADLAAELTRQGHPDAHYIADFDAAAEYIVQHVEPEAVVITLSAGDGNQVGQNVLSKIDKRRPVQTANTENATSG
ncbi:MAG: UDP-N-acetylmuramate--L-alanine ligase [Anaerolineae bacterium]|nr:UDP-N-acetylmuramate--L-alanine ligase [Anaerolineae bacterium]